LFYASSEADTYPVNVTSFGAKCDGITDDTAPTNAAIANVTRNFTNTSGGSVVFPLAACVIPYINANNLIGYYPLN
jgi:polygalacturonase